MLESNRIISLVIQPPQISVSPDVSSCITPSVISRQTVWDIARATVHTHTCARRALPEFTKFTTCKLELIFNERAPSVLSFLVGLKMSVKSAKRRINRANIVQCFNEATSTCIKFIFLFGFAEKFGYTTFSRKLDEKMLVLTKFSRQYRFNFCRQDL
ncbi:uncharacterized protein LOC118648911 [Monomorium pharaonis]|uniref:uncharacterized protein LOC118648911 n=1 Tax=Monomorium pharaonis TaxID=307658 RepID=UPI0017477A58|nr:uncharacterized protein LOC118648911 [Monomorium pharaonis]